MNQNDLKPALEFARNFGCKCVAFGGPGSGKTPICATTPPRPVLLLSEPGLLSMRKATTPTFPAFTPAKVDEFMLWFTLSNESRNYDTLVWDSASQSAEAFLAAELGGTSKAGNEQHGQRAYGKMSRWLMEHLTTLYFLPQKHVVLITKMQNFEINGAIYKRPYFPGRELPVRVPHFYDLVTQLGDYNIPGVIPAPTKAFRTKESFDGMGRDRSGNLNEYEPPNLSTIFTKVMAK